MLGVILLILSLFTHPLGQSLPSPGQRANLASFGRIKAWPGADAERQFAHQSWGQWSAVAELSGGRSNLGVEWDEPREFDEIRLTAPGVSPQQVELQYWVSSWPPMEGRGGWTPTDSPWIGEWRTLRSIAQLQNGELLFRFQPLSEEENPNAKRRPGWAPVFRQALKVRLRFSSSEPPRVSALAVFGASHWNQREVWIETGCEGHSAQPVSLAAYNGRILHTRTVARRTIAQVLYTEHPPDSNDRTILTVHTPQHSFGVAMDDLLKEGGIYLRDAGIFLSDGVRAQDFEKYLGSGRLHPGRDIHSLVAQQQEQSLERAMAEIPALNMTNRRPFRYVPLGFPGNREKYALLFNGNVYLSKRESKLFQEELEHLQWQGDAIYFKFATGEAPDFRERERAATQHMLEDILPVTRTTWHTEGIAYTQEAFATLVDAPLDPLRNRGDEPSVLLIRLSAENRKTKALRSRVWFYIDPAEKLRLNNAILESTATAAGERYPAPRFRAVLQPSAGRLQVLVLPAEAVYSGEAVRWDVELAPGASATLDVRLTLKTDRPPNLLRRLAALDYAAARSAVLAYWRTALNDGMHLQVPDEPFNRFWPAVLQHILLSVQRDVFTGLYMAPCGTLRYNMFANETNMQVRLLDMRGLHDWAEKFLEPFLALQGSKPFPGRFRQTDAIFHGVRIDASHDYTHSGYNLNHGWTLWTAAEHYLFTRNKEWLRATLPKLRKAADWIISERQASMRTTPEGEKVWEYGLLPPGQLEDNEEWFHWFAVNAYAYRGLRAAAEAIADIDPAEGARLAKQAASYRDDIRAAALRSMAAAPAVPLRDGAWVPLIPPRTHLHGRDYGWIRNILYGALTLIDCAVFEPGEPVAEWILKDYEDNLFMSPWSFSVPESGWFSRGGITLQPNLVNTPLVYLWRDEIAHALRPFYNTFAVSYYPDVNAFTEWVPMFGTSGGPFYKTSDEACFLTWLRLFLLREDGDVLKIAFGAPRRWFRTGERIVLHQAAAFFGPVSYEIRSRLADGYIDADLKLPQNFRAKRILLRLRHPENKKLIRVEVNKTEWPQFHPTGETIELPPTSGQTTVRAYFER
jgi:hypothetical protein